MEDEKGFFLPALIYTALQVLTAISLRDFWLEDILPFSCCPMFMLPRNPFDEWPKWWTMCDSPISGSNRTVGAMEPLYWSPASPIFELPLEEARKLPQKVLWFGSTQNCPNELRKFVRPECQNLPFVLFANFDVEPKLIEILRAVVTETSSGDPAGEPSRAWDRSSMEKILAMQDEGLRLFEANVAAARKADMLKSS